MQDWKFAPLPPRPSPGCSIRVMKQESHGAAQFLDEAVMLANTNAQKDSARWSRSLTLLFLWRWCKIGNVFVLQNPPAMQKALVWFLGWEDLLEERLSTPVLLDFPCGSAGKESACNVGDLGLIPGLGSSPGAGNGYPLQYSCLENSMDYIYPWDRKELDTTEELSHLYLQSL